MKTKQFFQKLIAGVFLITAANSYAQFFGLVQRNPAEYYQTALSYPKDGKYRVLSITLSAPVGLSFSYIHSHVRVYDENFILEDSISIINGVYPFDGEATKVGPHLFWPAIYADTMGSGNQQLVVLELDTNYKYVDLHPIDQLYQRAISECNLIFTDSCFFVSQSDNSIGSSSTIYKLSKNFSKLDSVSIVGDICEMWPIGNNILIRGAYVAAPCEQLIGNPTTQRLVMDKDLVFLDCSSLDSLTSVYENQMVQYLGLMPFYSSFIPVTTSKIFVTGFWDIDYTVFQAPMVAKTRAAIVNSILDLQGKVVNSETVYDTTYNYNSLNGPNLVAIQNGEIITVGCIGHDFSKFMVQEQKSWIFINKLDTNGNTIWQRRIGGDMYYHPKSIIYTADSGIMIAGLRYDSAKTIQKWHMQSFLLKLDKDGNYNAVGLTNDGSFKEGEINIYPNPSGGVIFLDAPVKTLDVVQIINSEGRLVKSSYNYAVGSAIDFTGLDKGIYLVKALSDSRHFTKKVIIAD